MRDWEVAVGQEEEISDADKMVYMDELGMSN